MMWLVKGCSIHRPNQHSTTRSHTTRLFSFSLCYTRIEYIYCIYLVWCIELEKVEKGSEEQSECGVYMVNEREVWFLVQIPFPLRRRAVHPSILRCPTFPPC
jgi:hypothetical protein